MVKKHVPEPWKPNVDIHEHKWMQLELVCRRMLSITDRSDNMNDNIETVVYSYVFCHMYSVSDRGTSSCIEAVILEHRIIMQ